MPPKRLKKPPVHTCTHCKAQFPLKAALHRHLRSHTKWAKFRNLQATPAVVQALVLASYANSTKPNNNNSNGSSSTETDNNIHATGTEAETLFAQNSVIHKEDNHNSNGNTHRSSTSSTGRSRTTSRTRNKTTKTVPSLTEIAPSSSELMTTLPEINSNTRNNPRRSRHKRHHDNTVNEEITNTDDGNLGTVQVNNNNVEFSGYSPQQQGFVSSSNNNKYDTSTSSKRIRKITMLDDNNDNDNPRMDNYANPSMENYGNSSSSSSLVVTIPIGSSMDHVSSLSSYSTAYHNDHSSDLPLTRLPTLSLFQDIPGLEKVLSYVCPIKNCVFQCTHKREIRHHFKSVHNNLVSFECRTCGLPTKHWKVLLEHTAICNGLMDNTTLPDNHLFELDHPSIMNTSSSSSSSSSSTMLMDGDPHSHHTDPDMSWFLKEALGLPLSMDFIHGTSSSSSSSALSSNNNSSSCSNVNNPSFEYILPSKETRKNTSSSSTEPK